MGGWVGGGMDIACLRQVVAFAPKVINAPSAQSMVIIAPPTASHMGGGGF
jgi:hypothetical protein